MPNFKKYYIIPATPAEVYTALTHPGVIEVWSGSEAEMSEEPNTEFMMWDGSIVGLNLEFVKDKKIVQRWYFDEREEDSIVTIKLHADPKGTSLELQHTNIPNEDFDNITEGWTESYMGLLIDYFEVGV